MSLRQRQSRTIVCLSDSTTDSQGVYSSAHNELTGVLAPLPDERFFQQVFIDNRAVAWAGEIDLAPDAVYAQIVSLRQEVT